MKKKLIQAIAEMQETEAVQLAQAMLDANEDPQLVLDACREAMTIVGSRYEEGDYFLPHLIVAGDLLQEIGELVKPKLAAEQESEQPLGEIVIGTVAGDVHDIGKDIVAFMLEVNGFKVHDLGVDVSAEKFVEKINEVQPDILALSGFLTLAFDSMKETVQAITANGLRDNLKIMIGGAPMDESVTKYIGADNYGRDATAAVRMAKDWIGGN
jgi:methanogenic corrinoid protein MtbC1